LKFAFGGVFHESNTFCPCKTTLKHFQNGYLGCGKDIISTSKGKKGFFGGVIDAASELAVQLYPTIAAAASPYGPVEKTAFDYITSKLLLSLEQAGTIDGVILCLHGGMVAENYLDPEGEILFLVREKVGPKIPIVCTLDMHANFSQRMVDTADAFFGNNENPHLDSYDRGVEASQVLYKIAKGRLKPVMALKKPGMLPPTLKVNPPHSGPMVKLFNRAFAMEKNPQVINVNMASGFPWSDVPDVGMGVVTVVHKDRGLAEKLAEELCQKLWDARQEFLPSLTPIDEAVEKAMRAEKGPVILADVADNPGDGTTEDSTGILRSLIQHGATEVGFALIHDPEAVEKCVSTGVGSQVTLDVGGKDPTWGDPVTLTGTVKTLSDGVFWPLGPLYGGHQVGIGRTVVLETKGIEIIIAEHTYPPNDPEVFRRHGIEPSRKKILVVKTFKMHMEPNYRPFTKEIIEVDAPGQASPNLKRFNWTRIPRPMFPIDDV
jgi:microcystin degradation protein MlrC